MHCYGHLLRGGNDHVLVRTLEFGVEGQRMKWKLKMTFRKQVYKECMMVGVSMEDLSCQLQCIVCVNHVATMLR